MLKEDFVRGGGGPVPPPTGGLPGWLASMSFVWNSIASETDTHNIEELGKKRVQGIPCHSWSTTRRSTASHQSAGRCMRPSRRLRDTFLQIAKDGSFYAFSLPEAVHAKKIEIWTLGAT